MFTYSSYNTLLDMKTGLSISENPEVTNL